MPDEPSIEQGNPAAPAQRARAAVDGHAAYDARSIDEQSTARIIFYTAAVDEQKTVVSGMDGRYHCPVKDAQRLGLDDPRVSKDALRKAYLREAKKAHPDAGGSAASFRGVADAHERLLAFRSERAAGALRERRFQSKYHAKSDFADRITHVLSRPLGNLVSTQTKLRFRLGAFAVLMVGFVADALGDGDGERRRRRGRGAAPPASTFR